MTTPTKTGVSAGVDAGVRWCFEPADEHWRLHDHREVSYWRSRQPEERLAQAAYYRRRVHGLVTPPARVPWRMVPAFE